jgi:small subunit ribosomal protein S1
VIEFDGNGKNIILSRRPVIDKIKRREKEELKKTLKEGMSVTGKVASITDFGAFIDIGGISGLLPISEVSWGRVDNIKDSISEGEELRLEIIRLDWEKDRITLSLKSTKPDPWISAEKNYQKGAFHRGVISKLTKFGAFVTLKPGIDGLIHISQIGKGQKIKHPSDVLSEKQIVTVMIENIDSEKKRISLRFAEKEEQLKDETRQDDWKTYGAGSGMSMGTLGDVLKGKLKKGVKSFNKP